MHHSLDGCHRAGGLRLLSRTLLLSALGLSVTAVAAPAPAAPQGGDEPELGRLERQLEALQGQVSELLRQNRALAHREKALERRLQQQGDTGTSGASNAPQAGLAVAPPAAASASSALPASSSVLPSSSALPTSSALPSSSASASSVPDDLRNWHPWGYGEIYYSRPTRDSRHTQFDLARAVIGIGYTFDPKTEFNSEFEVEHAVASANDAGEFEVEQFYIDRQLAQEAYVQAGLMLMPFGLLNEHHEPVYFYGVQRNFVETLIIPSTWREGGIAFHGDTAFGLGWNAGVTTGIDLSKWNFAPEFPMYTTPLELEDNSVAPLQATHQELELANAQHLFEYVALDYHGLLGLTVGGAIGTGDAAKVPAPPNAPIPGSEHMTLWEGHARWTPGRFDLAALYAHGQISNVALANVANPGSPNPIPSDFYGYYLQGAYQAWEHGEYRLNPFVRWETYNMGSRYEGTPGPLIPAGLTPLSAAPGDYGYWPRGEDRVFTTGANFYITSHVVVKADYQWFRVNRDFDRLDLGLGINY